LFVSRLHTPAKTSRFFPGAPLAYLHKSSAATFIDFYSFLLKAVLGKSSVEHHKPSQDNLSRMKVLPHFSLMKNSQDYFEIS
jgi:hypothetical protein